VLQFISCGKTGRLDSIVEYTFPGSMAIHYLSQTLPIRNRIISLFFESINVTICYNWSVILFTTFLLMTIVNRCNLWGAIPYAGLAVCPHGCAIWPRITEWNLCWILSAFPINFPSSVYSWVIVVSFATWVLVAFASACAIRTAPGNNRNNLRCAWEIESFLFFVVYVFGEKCVLIGIILFERNTWYSCYQ